MSDLLFHCGICHRETADLTKHRREMHPSGGFAMEERLRDDSLPEVAERARYERSGANTRSRYGRIASVIV